MGNIWILGLWVMNFMGVDPMLGSKGKYSVYFLLLPSFGGYLSSHCAAQDQRRGDMVNIKLYFLSCMFSYFCDTFRCYMVSLGLVKVFSCVYYYLK